MRKKQTRTKNPNWKGGRTITQHGYVLVKVGTEHSLADVRGYAYEHRVVAEAMLERPLTSSELVHHKNGDTQDNRQENLEVLPDIAHHRRSHTTNENLKSLGAENPVISCACGCGTKFPKYDKWNRPRTYVSGHNLYPTLSGGIP